MTVVKKQDDINHPTTPVQRLVLTQNLRNAVVKVIWLCIEGNALYRIIT
jgi:hypothetical protein